MALETQEQENKLLETTVHVNFTLVGLFGFHLLSHVDIYSLYGGIFLRLCFWIVLVITSNSLNRGSLH